MTHNERHWIPAFAGMTIQKIAVKKLVSRLQCCRLQNRHHLHAIRTRGRHQIQVMTLLQLLAIKLSSRRRPGSSVFAQQTAHKLHAPNLKNSP